MATLVSTLFISLDGVAEIEPEWHFPYFDDNMAAAVDADDRKDDVVCDARICSGGNEIPSGCLEELPHFRGVERHDVRHVDEDVRAVHDLGKALACDAVDAHARGSSNDGMPGKCKQSRKLCADQTRSTDDDDLL